MGTTGMSFGGGFASGIATALSNKRQRDEQDKSRQISNLWKGIGFLVDSGQVSDIADLQPQFDALSALGAFGDPKAQKKGQPGPQDHVTNILGHIIRKGGGVSRGTSEGNPPANALPLPGAQQVQGATGPNDAGDMIAPTELPSTNLHMTPQEAQRRTLMGIPLMTPQEKIEHQTDLQAQQLWGQIEARRRIAERLGLQGEHAQRYAATGQFPIDPLSRVRPQSVAGESINPSSGAWEPAFAAFVNGQYVDPDTFQPIENFRPRSTTGSMSLGADREALARELYGKRAADLTPEEMTSVNAKAQERAAGKAGAVTTARAEAESVAPLSSAKSIDVQRQLQEDWTKANEPVKEMGRQYVLMTTGLKRFKEGDKVGGSEAVISTFKKVLDPGSVVRESEYARTPEGLGILQRLDGMWERAKEGGAGVPVEVLEGMVETANQFTKNMEHYNDDTRRRLTLTARKAKLNPADIFGDETKAPTTTTAAPATKAPAAKKDANGNWVLTIP